MLSHVGQHPMHRFQQAPTLAAVHILRQFHFRLGNPRKGGAPARLHRGECQSQRRGQLSIRRAFLRRKKQFLIGRPQPQLLR